MTAHFVTAKSGSKTFKSLLLISGLVSLISCSGERNLPAGEETPEPLAGAVPPSIDETPDTPVAAAPPSVDETPDKPAAIVPTAIDEVPDIPAVTVPPAVDETPLDPISSTPDGTTDSNEEITAEPLDIDALSTRLSNEACLAGDPPVDPVLLQRMFEGVELRNPLAMEQAPGEENAPFYVAEKGGRIVAIPARDDATEADATTVLQLDVHTDGESGITALAFHPDYAINRRVFVGYGSQNQSGQITLRLSEFESSPDGLSFDQERVVLDIPKDNPLHFGGAIVFGPDGYLYMSVGDDGNNLDGDTHPEGAQDPNSVYGSILRIDVDDQSGTRRYGIPADNPDLTGKGPAEVWSYGFRNPWRMSFDRQPPHDLWASNVGSRETEEIDIVSAGSNHGWPMCEGPCDPRQVALVDPVYSYSNKGGAAAIGGYLYRGAAVPELYGKYLFGDYVKQDVRVLDPSLLPKRASVRTAINDSAL